MDTTIPPRIEQLVDTGLPRVAIREGEVSAGGFNVCARVVVASLGGCDHVLHRAVLFNHACMHGDQQGSVELTARTGVHPRPCSATKRTISNESVRSTMTGHEQRAGSWGGREGVLRSATDGANQRVVPILSIVHVETRTRVDSLL
jgi:hypothetical protein